MAPKPNPTKNTSTKTEQHTGHCLSHCLSLYSRVHCHSEIVRESSFELSYGNGRAVDVGGGGGGGGGSRRRRRRGGVGAEGGVLRAELPARGGDGEALRGAARPPRPLRRRHPHPHPFPRLLRQGVRRVGVAERDGRGGGGEGRGAEPDAPGVRLHRPHQERRRARVPRRSLLRRHPRARHPRRHLRHRRAVLAGADGAARRDGVDQAGGAGSDPGADHELHRTPLLLPEQGPRPRRPRLVVRGAHDRHRALQLVQQAAVQFHRKGRPRRRRPVAGHGVRGEPAAEQVHDAVGQHDDRGDGPRQLPHLRPGLLPWPPQAPWPVPVRRRPHHRRGGGGQHRQRGGQPAGGVLPGVREVHGEAGHGRRQDRVPGGDQEALRPCQRQPLLVLAQISSSARCF